MKTPPDHRSQVFGTPWEGVHATAMDSARHYGRHWHSTYGVGLLDHGAQSSASGRGRVDAYAGDLITTNPGEVHDGRPLGGPSRRWRMVYFDAAVMAGMREGVADASIEFTRPVLQDARLLRERLADDLLAAPTLDELAAMTGLGKYQVLRRFEKAYGVPPHAWLLLQRAERARGLIRRGTGLADAAAASGFADQSHMTRIFARQFGFTPGAWQRTCGLP